MAKRAKIEGFRMLDDFVCDAIHEPGIPQADATKQGKNEGIRVIEELVLGASENKAEDKEHDRSLITDVQRQRLERVSRLGKPVVHKLKGGGHSGMGIVEDEVYVIVNDYKHVIQKISGMYSDGSQYAYRTGYYTYDAKRKRIVWGQYTQFLTEQEYKQLLSKARAKGWAIF